MIRSTTLVTAGLMLLALPLSLPARADENKAVAVIEKKLGAGVIRDAKKPGKPVVQVDFTSNSTGHVLKDADLVHLKPLKHLKVLYLSYTGIGDAGLAHLRDLKSLHELHLAETKITDKGLVHLKGLTELRKLGMPFCGGITDAGLVHLTRLKKLEFLNLSSTKVTEQGAARLEKALPKAYISR